MDIKRVNEKVNAGVNEIAEQDQSVQSRRKFTRGATLGGAVLLTLGNRSAWSQEEMLCVSTQNWNSFSRGGVSLAPSTDAMQAELQRFEDQVFDNGGTDSTFISGDQTCTARQPN
jgi:hypothetical protein